MAVTLVILIVFVGACSQNASPTNNADAAAIREYADPATKTTLEGLSENNIDKYTQYADEQFKAALTQSVFDKTASQINEQLGILESITFLSTEALGEYIIVHYKVKYAKGEVGVRMVFDREHRVSGQWFE